MDRTLTLLIDCQQKEQSAKERRRKRLQFNLLAEAPIRNAVRDHYSFRQDRDFSEAEELLHVENAEAACRERCDRVLELKRHRDTENPVFGTLRFLPYCRAIAQQLAASLGGFVKTTAGDESPSPATNPSDDFDKRWTAFLEENRHFLDTGTGNNESQLADAVQNTYLKLREHFSGHSLDKIDSPSAYFNRAMQNEAHSVQRSMKKHDHGKLSDLAELEVPEEEVEASAYLPELRQSVRRIVQNLNPEECELVIAFIIDELKPKSVLQKFFYLGRQLPKSGNLSQRREDLLKKLLRLLRHESSYSTWLRAPAKQPSN